MLAGAATLLFSAVYRHVGRVAAMCFALALIVVPQDGEIWLTVTNLQWILGPLLLVLLWREFVAEQVFPARVFYLDAVLIVLLALTGPFGLVFSAFVIGAAFIKGRHEWTRRTWGLFVAYGLALTAQMACLLHASSQGGFGQIQSGRFPLDQCFPSIFCSRFYKSSFVERSMEWWHAYLRVAYRYRLLWFRVVQDARELSPCVHRTSVLRCPVLGTWHRPIWAHRPAHAMVDGRIEISLRAVRILLLDICHRPFKGEWRWCQVGSRCTPAAGLHFQRNGFCEREMARDEYYVASDR